MPGTGEAAQRLLRTPDERLDTALLRSAKAREEAKRALAAVESNLEHNFRNDRGGQHACLVVLSQPSKWLSKLVTETAYLETAVVETRTRAASAVMNAFEHVHKLQLERDALSACLTSEMRQIESENAQCTRVLSDGWETECQKRADDVAALNACLDDARGQAKAEAHALRIVREDAAAAATVAASEVADLRRANDEQRMHHEEQQQAATAVHEAEVAKLRETIASQEAQIDRLQEVVRSKERQAVNTCREWSSRLEALEATKAREASAALAAQAFLEEKHAENMEGAKLAKQREKQHGQAERLRLEWEKADQHRQLTAQLEAIKAQQAREMAAMRQQMARVQTQVQRTLGIADSTSESGTIVALACVDPHHRSAPVLPCKPRATSHKAATTCKPLHKSNGAATAGGRASGAPGGTPAGTTVRGRQWLYWHSLKTRLDEASVAGLSNAVAQQIKSIESTAAATVKQRTSPRTLIDTKHSPPAGFPTGLSASQATTLTQTPKPQGDWLPLRSAREIVSTSS